MARSAVTGTIRLVVVEKVGRLADVSPLQARQGELSRTAGIEDSEVNIVRCWLKEPAQNGDPAAYSM